jgi:O-antigen/teichoic acid export membrane protein
VPRWLVSHYLGHRELGVFVSIFYLVMIGSRAVGALAQSAGPRLAKHYAAGDGRAFARLVVRLLGIVALVGAGVILTVAVAGGPILRLLYGLDYTPYLRTAVWLMAAGGLMYLSMPLGMATDAMRRFKTHMVIRGAGVAVLAALLPGLIAAWGLLGAAWGLAIGFGLLAALYAAVVGWEVHRLIKPRPVVAPHTPVTDAPPNVAAA